MKAKRMIFLLVTLAAGLHLVPRVAAQMVVVNSVLGNGGAVLSDSSCHIASTVGQPIIGVAQNPTTAAHLGFWFLPDPVIITGIEQSAVLLPLTYSLEQNYPNPLWASAFNPETEIRFQLPVAGSVVLTIYNVLGQQIRRLVEAQFEAGYYSVRWNGKDKNGNQAPSGVYFYRLQAGTFFQVKKMSLLR